MALLFILNSEAKANCTVQQVEATAKELALLLSNVGLKKYELFQIGEKVTPAFISETSNREVVSTVYYAEGTKSDGTRFKEVGDVEVSTAGCDGAEFQSATLANKNILK